METCRGSAAQQLAVGCWDGTLAMVDPGNPGSRPRVVPTKLPFEPCSITCGRAGLGEPLLWVAGSTGAVALCSVDGSMLAEQVVAGDGEQKVDILDCGSWLWTVRARPGQERAGAACR